MDPSSSVLKGTFIEGENEDFTNRTITCLEPHSNVYVYCECFTV
jgi:hypothetical protein